MADTELEVIDVPRGSIPNIGMEAEEVEGTEFEYSTRAPGDWVSSGPLFSGGGPGRRFDTWDEAERWARAFYGTRLKGRIPDAQREGHNRYAFLIKGPRGVISY